MTNFFHVSDFLIKMVMHTHKEIPVFIHLKTITLGN